MAARVFLHRGKPDGKRSAAVYFKNHCNREDGTQTLNELLDDILAPSKPLWDWETIDWCKWLMAGGQTPDEFAKTVRLYDNTTTCGLVWTSNFVAYRCRTCGISLYMSLCADCFRAGNHDGHDYNMFRSQAGGACDCGDPNVMKEDGFCPKHGPSRAVNFPHLPEDLLSVAKAMMPRIILRLVQHLRDKSTTGTLDSYLIAMKDADVYLNFLHELSDMGAAMRSVFTHILINPVIYHDLTEGRADMQDRQEMFQAAVKEMPKPAVFRQDLHYDDGLEHRTFLDELCMWTVKYEFPQKLVTLLLNMLTDNDYKEAFTRAFIQYYSRISMALANSKQADMLSNRVVHVSVQLFSNEQLAFKMAKDHHLITTMLISLHYMIGNVLIEDSEEDSFHQSVNCAERVMKQHCYWPLVSDLINILSHKPVTLYFIEELKLLEAWFDLLTYFQGMNVNKRELTQHVEYEPNTYYAAFSAELEACSSPLWVLSSHLKTKETLKYTKLVLDKCVEAVKDWFDACGNIHCSMYKMSFHIPLHRWYALLVSQAVQFQEASLDDLLPAKNAEDVLWEMMMHPLQIQVSFYEIFCGMWVRNGLQIKGQAMTYVQCHFCNSTIDPDIYLLQVCACRLDPDRFLTTVLDRFHVGQWLSFGIDSKPFLEKDKEASMLEGMLILLAQILSIRLHLGLTEADITKLEVVTLLAIHDRTHSQLLDQVPEKCGITGQPSHFEQILSEVADYRAPNLQSDGELQQGMYTPKEDTWNELYDPLHVLLRAVHRRDFQMSMNRFSQHLVHSGKIDSGQSAWPPFRRPNPPLSAYSRLLNLLHCKTMHGIIFSLLYRAVKEPNLPEQIMYLTIYLLEFAVDTSAACLQDQTTVAYRAPDMQYDAWFPSNCILTNIRHSISSIAIPSSENEHGRMFAELEKIERRAKHFLAAHGVKGMETDESKGDATSSKETSKTDSPKKRKGGISSTIAVDVQDGATSSEEVIEINESILSLLIKLHAKLSEKKCSYVPRSQRQRTNGQKLDEVTGQIGDGAFFIGQLLDKVSVLSAASAQRIEEICEAQRPKVSVTNQAQMAKEERKRKARERQKRLMEEFAGRQKKFLEQTMETEEAEGESMMQPDMGAAEEEVEVMTDKYDCVICGQTTASTEDRPVGMVTMLSPTSVLGRRSHIANADQARSLPVDEKTDCFYHGDCGTAAAVRWTQLQKFFHEKSCSLSLNMNYEGGVLVQTCGHYLHLDCLHSYTESLRDSVHQDSHKPFKPEKGEYLCPLCRQLANSFLPCRPLPSNEQCLPVPSNMDMISLASDIMNLLLQDNQDAFDHVMNSSPKLQESDAAIISALRKASFAKYRSYQPGNKMLCNYFSLPAFARCNLELELLQTGGSLGDSMTCLPLAATTRKMCTKSLMQMLELHAKSEDLAPFALVWSLISCIPAPESVISDVQQRWYSTEEMMPLLLHDTASLLVGLVLALPLGMHKAYYTCIVQSLYNLQVIQAVAILTCQFSEQERETWRHKTESLSLVEKTVAIVLSHLVHSRLYEDSEDLATTTATVHCQQTWSMESAEKYVNDACLPFLKLAALLQYHLYNDEWHSLTSVDSMDHLTRYLELHSNDETVQSCLRLLSLGGDDAQCKALIKSWCNEFISSITRGDMPSKSLLMRRFSWNFPRLLSLPHEYDKIFTYYRTKQCNNCGLSPKEPAVCLICGVFMCMRDHCCKQQEIFECVQHSMDCGAGTGIFLAVNSSLVIIVSGARACIWGSVYLDSFGEEDRDLRRGKPLYLSGDRYKLLEQQWINNSFDRTVKKWIWHSDKL